MFIDIHSHILPGLDDGSQNIEESLAIAELAVKAGITTIVATPHAHHPGGHNTAGDIYSAVAELNKVIKQNNINTKILAGSEVRISHLLPSRAAQSQVVTLNSSRYILLELPHARVPDYTSEVIYELLLKGYLPIIAHPERNQEILQEPNILYNLVAQGCLSQITASSLTDIWGSNVKQLALSAIANDCAHFIATDSHRPNSKRSDISTALEAINSHLDEAQINQLLHTNPKMVIEDKEIITDDPIEFTNVLKKRSFLSRIWKR